MFSRFQGIANSLRGGEANPKEEDLAGLLREKGVVSSRLQQEVEAAIRLLFNPNKAKQTILALQKQPYDKNNPDHERTLLRLWEELMPDERLTARVSPQWRTSSHRLFSCREDRLSGERPGH